ncbi:alpha-amylase family glycosyl hydrolase [Gilvibacter sediminis]|uniref:alpha-amylase family glycosyl hydrolase n=1 Tax=Gilvibacter sediminis TaxID=379071 RepID=UPI002350B62B|nr:alpha-amylase family glycosyl hydrolase [Gilvibacter sediminis]MDC7998090.1 alpha-amylase family glycosyl hydrolase [Gilvibacter sediminis]
MSKNPLYRAIFLLLISALWISCNDKTSNEEPMNETLTTLPPLTDEFLETAILYEANIRQYSPEGSFDAFTADIPKLKDLGVDVIWLMPVYPISSTKRKAYGNVMADDIDDPEERKKYLGSYYAVSDYTRINPEFGTLEDFRRLVQTAHDNGIYVILDWVANHTGWDHHWIEEHPEYYTKNEAGEVSEPLKDDGRTPEGWTDVADLNFDNPDLTPAMIAEMRYWIAEENIDGFRCDVAGFVPTDFWRKAIPELRKEKAIFMLAEADNPELLEDGLFDMAYGWANHHLMNDIAKGEQPAAQWWAHYNGQMEKWADDDYLMNFVENHDENSWNGTFLGRTGAHWESCLVLSYALPGMPLIYSGLEYDLNHSLKFFEKDSIPKNKGKIWPVLEQLAKVKKEVPALNGGVAAGAYEWVDTFHDPDLLAFRRFKDDSEVLYLANFGSETKNLPVKALGSFRDFKSGEIIEIQGEKSFEIPPASYLFLIKN